MLFGQTELDNALFYKRNVTKCFKLYYTPITMLTILPKPVFDHLIFLPGLNSSQGDTISKWVTELHGSEPVETEVGIEVTTIPKIVEAMRTVFLRRRVVMSMALCSCKLG